MAVVYLVARFFSLHPETVKRTFTLRQAIAFIDYEMSFLDGKISITKPVKTPTLDQTALRLEALKFFRPSRESEDG